MKPKLRFKEFSDEWEEKKLGDIFNLIRNGVNIKQFGHDGTPITRIESISNGYLNTDRLGYASIEDDAYEDFYLKKGDILFSHINSLKHIGKVAYVKKNYKIIHGMNLLLLKANDDARFAFYLLSTDMIKYQYKVLAKPAVNQASLSISDLKNIKAYIPSLPEQEKIGQFLSLVDKRIEKQEQRIELLKERKKGWMQKIFNQEIRFKDENGNDYPDWEEKKLGDIFNLIRNGVNIKQFGHDGTPITRIESISNGYLNTDRLGYASIEDDAYEDFYLKKGDILFSHINSLKHIGKVAYVKKNYKIIHGMNLLLLKANDDARFAFYLLSTDMIKYQYKVLAKPAVNQASLSISDLKNIKAYIPSLPEQEKIAGFLSKQDELIEQEERKLELLKEQKKGVLQQMFV